MSPATSHRAKPRSTRPKKPAGKRASKASTRDLLLDVGEKLFGRRGFDGISLREIAKVAGQANNAVVHYYFKDKPGLISAILENRGQRIEALRREWLTQINPDRPPQPRDLLRILWLPMTSITDSQGGHTYVQFLLQHLLHPGMAQHPIEVFNTAAGKRRMKSKLDVSALAKVLELLRAHYPNLSQTTFSRRLSTLSLMFVSAVVEHDNAHLTGKSARSALFDPEPILDMALAALAAPG